MISYRHASGVRPLSEFTRGAAYYSLSDLSEKQEAVFRVVRLNGALPNRKIARVLGWEINRVTPRIKELREAGFVEAAGIVFDKETQRQVVAWRVKA